MIIQRIQNSLNKTITRKLIIGISAVHAILMSIFVFDLISRENDFLVKQHKSQAQSLVKTLAINASSSTLSNDLIALEEIIAAQQDYPNINYSMIVNLHNKVLAYTDTEKVGFFLKDSISNQLLNSPIESIILINDEMSIDIAFPIMSNYIHIGWARVNLSKNSILENINLVTTRGAFYSLVAIFIGIIFAWLMAKNLISRIFYTTKYLKEFESGKRQIKMENIQNDELGQLNRGLKRMFDTLTRQEALLKENNNILEVQVDSRTKALESANRNLITYQQELVEKEKFAQLGQLVAGVSHEMNTPLGIALTSASIIKDKVEEIVTQIDSQKLSKSSLSNSLNKIQDAQVMLEGNISRCITLILAFKKISTDRNINEVRVIKLLDYIKDTFQTLSILLKKEKITLSIQGYNCDISIEPSLLAQVLTNLVTNSITHAFVNKKEQKKITVIITKQKSWITIEYKDNGCGMSKSVMKHAFEPFYTTKRGEGGTGLGMNIMYNLVRQNMGGNITLNSVVNEGTSVFIQLPKS